MKQEEFHRMAIVVKRNQQDWERENPKTYSSSSSSSYKPAPKIYYSEEHYQESESLKGIFKRLLSSPEENEKREQYWKEKIEEEKKADLRSWKYMEAQKQEENIKILKEDISEFEVFTTSREQYWMERQGKAFLPAYYNKSFTHDEKMIAICIAEYNLKYSLLFGNFDSCQKLIGIYKNTLPEREYEIIKRLLLEAGSSYGAHQCREELGYRRISIFKEDLSTKAVKVVEGGIYYIGRGINYLNNVINKPTNDSNTKPENLMGFSTAVSNLVKIIKENFKNTHYDDIITPEMLLKTLKAYNESVPKEFRLPDDSGYYNLLKSNPKIKENHPFLTAYQEINQNNDESNESNKEESEITKHVQPIKISLNNSKPEVKKEPISSPLSEEVIDIKRTEKSNSTTLIEVTAGEKVYCSYNELTITKPYYYTVDGNKLTIEKFRSINFPDSIKPGKEVSLQFALKEPNGRNMPEKQEVFFKIKYNDQGKLVELSVPGKCFVSKGGDAPVILVLKGNTYTLPINSKLYSHLVNKVKLNNGTFEESDLDSKSEIVDLNNTGFFSFLSSQKSSQISKETIKPINEKTEIIKQPTQPTPSTRNEFSDKEKVIKTEVVLKLSMANSLPTIDIIVESQVYGTLKEIEGTKPYDYTVSGKKCTIDYWRLMTFPDSLKPGKEIELSLPLKNDEGYNISKNIIAYFKVVYNEQGKLVKISNSHQPFISTIDDKPVVVWVNGELYSYPVNSKHYQHLVEVVNINNGVVEECIIDSTSYNISESINVSVPKETTKPINKKVEIVKQPTPPNKNTIINKEKSLTEEVVLKKTMIESCTALKVKVGSQVYGVFKDMMIVKPYNYTVNDKKYTIEQSKLTIFPNSIYPGKEIELSIPLKDVKGYDISQNIIAYFKVVYNEQGKLVKISSSHEPCISKSDDKPVVIIVKGELYSYPVNSKHYQHLAKLVNM